MKKYLMIILLIALSIDLVGQDYCFENGPPLCLKPQSKSKIYKNKAKIDKLHIQNIKESCRWAYYWRKSSYELYTNGDSTSFFLKEALNAKSDAVCRIMNANREIIEYKIELGQIGIDHKWYYTDIELSDKKYVDSICTQYDFVEKERTYDEMSNLERRIMFNDQEGRKVKEIDWSKQDKLDELNRELLDSIFLKNNYLRGFSTFEIDAFSLVLHHSSDCEWNLKWFEILLEAKLKYNLEGGKYLGLAFDRMLNENDANGGWCLKENPSSIKTFVDKLRNTYSIEFAKKQGFLELMVNEK